MKTGLSILVGAALLMSSCGSYEATGAYTGSQFGNMIGSAIGGIAGGWRGHEIGSLIGTVGGAAAGAAIGHAADKAQERRYEERAAARQQQQVRQRRAATQNRSYDYGQSGYGQNGYGQNGQDQSGFDPQMRGDDRITFDDGSNTPNGGNVPNVTNVPNVSNTPNRGNAPSQGFGLGFGATAGPALVIRNAGVYEDIRDGVLTRGEACKVIFEIANNSDHPVMDVFPLVEESTGNRHIHISPNMRIESIAPHQSVRYTASLVADRGLRNGQIMVRVGVAQGRNLIQSQTRQFNVPTAKRTR